MARTSSPDAVKKTGSGTVRGRVAQANWAGAATLVPITLDSNQEVTDALRTEPAKRLPENRDGLAGCLHRKKYRIAFASGSYKIRG